MIKKLGEKPINMSVDIEETASIDLFDNKEISSLGEYFDYGEILDEITNNIEGYVKEETDDNDATDGF